MDGRLCGLGVWDRLLTGGELTTLFNGGVRLLYSSLTSGLKSGLAAYFDLAEASGDSYCKHTSGLILTDVNTVTSAAGPS